MNIIKNIVAASAVLLLTACGPNPGDLGKVINPQTGNFQKYSQWKAANGKSDVYGVVIKHVRVETNEVIGMLGYVALETEPDTKLADIRTAVAKLCDVSEDQVSSQKDDAAHTGEANTTIGGESLRCSYMKRSSDGAGTIILARK